MSVALRRLAFASFIALVPVVAVGTAAPAAEAPNSAKMQVKSGLYVTAKEAHELIKADPSVVLIDVRDPVEAMFTGFATETDIHVPYKIADRTKWNAKKNVFAMADNTAFVAEMEQRLAKLGVDKASAKLIFMCRSGSTRSAPAADLLYDRGWSQSYTMVDGFEGGKRKDGPSKGVRDVDGWRNAGLPWGYELPAEVVYISPK